MNIFLSVELLDSALPARIMLLGGFIAVFFSLKSKDTEGHVATFLFSLFYLLVRDIALSVLSFPGLLFVTDLVYVSIASFVILAGFDRRRVLGFPLVFINLAALAVFVLQEWIKVPLGIPVGLLPLVIVVDGIYLSVLGFYHRRLRDSQTRQLLRVIWPMIGFSFILYGLLASFTAYDNVRFFSLVVPLSYWWYLAAGLISFRMQDTQMVQACSYYEESIDSLYNLFVATGSALRGTFAIDDVLKNLNDTLIAETNADGGLIFLVDEFDDQISVKAHSGAFPPPFPLPESLPRKQNRIESYMRHLHFSLDETIFGEIAKSGSDLYIPDARNDARIADNGEEDFLYLSSFMAVPLMVEDRIIGLVAVARTTKDSFFTESEFDRYKLLANFGTLSLSHFFSFLEAKERSGLKQSADTAAEIQKAITPKRIPQFPTLQIGAYTQPALGVSGDYYDVIQTRKDRVIGVVGDVAGKGVAAALVMVMVRSILHLVTNTTRDMGTVLDWINRGMTGKVDIDHYATLAVMAIDLNTGEVEFSSAGHQPLLIYRRASDTLETVDLQSVPIGVERAAEYTRKIIKLAIGDIAVLYTDGIVEALNEQGKQYGRRGLSSMITRHKDLAPKEIVAKIKSDLSSFVGSTRQHDDQTVLVFKMKH